jgi:membrane fusion protein, copper/silver efflux system
MVSQAPPCRPDQSPTVEETTAGPLTWGRKLRMVVKAVELRLRFIALLAGTGLLFGYWETFVNYFETRNRPAGKTYEVSDRSEYYCPMHTHVVSEQSTSCPICGMPMARRERGATATSGAGLARVQLPPWRIAQAGIRTVEVGLAQATQELVTVGFVGYDETRHVLIASGTRGRARVDRLHVASVGVRVRAGQWLAELYGFDVAQSIRAYREAYRALAEPAGTPPDFKQTPLGDPKERVRIAIEGLKVLGVRQDQIGSITTHDDPEALLPLLAPISGHVIEKNVYEGQYAFEETVLFEIADLSRVWIDAQIYENQLALVCLGQPIEATVPAFPGEVFKGTVALIAPVLDPTTRTAAVRLDLDNPGLRLRPGMYANVTLNVALGGPIRTRGAEEQTICPVTRVSLGSMGPATPVAVEGRTVWVCCDACVSKLKSASAKYLALLDSSARSSLPSVLEAAVVDTGSKTIVYVEVTPGIFEGRAVVIGPRSGDHYPVLRGLAPGERVAAAGAFLIDAETRLNPPAQDTPPSGFRPP